MNILVKYIQVIIYFYCFLHFAKPQYTSVPLKYLRRWRVIVQGNLRNTIKRDNNNKILRDRNKLQPIIDDSVPFFCQLNGTRSDQVPTNVHMLRPGDIDVIGALGDSLTAGVGLTAKNIREVYLENRGMAPTSGGTGTWREFLTIPNILKVFNPNLVGYATKSALTIQKDSQFNVADTAAMSRDIPHMANLLIKRINSHPKVNFKNDWKLISMMIGPNDFCVNICYQKMEDILEGHRRDLIKALRILRGRIPRLFVSLILAPNLKILIEFMNRPLRCFLNHLFVCPCLIGEPFKKNRQNYINLMQKWQEVEMEVAALDEFDSETFTVVVQPFPINLSFPLTSNGQTDYTFFSEDCFHFSQKGSAMMANSIWNNMMEPVGRKTTRETELFTKLICPTEDSPYLKTRRNSWYG